MNNELLLASFLVNIFFIFRLCYKYIRRSLWVKNFTCPECEHSKHLMLPKEALYRCDKHRKKRAWRCKDFKKNTKPETGYTITLN